MTAETGSAQRLIILIPGEDTYIPLNSGHPRAGEMVYTPLPQRSRILVVKS